MLKILYKISYFKIPVFLMKYLISKKKIKSLKVVSKHGHYKDRIYIAEKINALSNDNKIQLIEILLDDKVEFISKLVIKFTKKTRLSEYVLEKAIEKEKFWKKKEVERDIKKEKMNKMLKNSTNRKRKFSNGESYQNAKNMLKKPMNTGRWM